MELCLQGEGRIDPDVKAALFMKARDTSCTETKIKTVSQCKAIPPPKPSPQFDSAYILVYSRFYTVHRRREKNLTCRAYQAKEICRRASEED